MKKVMNRIWTLGLLLIISAVASAQEAPVKVDLNESYTGGPIEVTGYDTSAGDGSVVVTILVSPAKDYQIARSDIQVVATVPAAGTREGSVSIAGDLVLSGTDPDNLSDERFYTFVVPSGKGAWVKEANFHVVEVNPEPQPGPEPQPQEPTNDISAEGSSVVWEKSDDNTTVTIKGDGATADFTAESLPWASIKDQITSVVIEKGVTSLGANLFAGCTALTSIRIDNAERVLGIVEGAVPANVTVNVPANLLTEYNITDVWKDLTMKSDGAALMDGITFSGNEYDTFAVSTDDQALMVPSVLKAYTITGISGSSLVLSEVTEIEKGMAVLVYNAKNVPSDVNIYTASLDDEEKVSSPLLKVAQDEGNGGHEVKLGDAYILYNDVFYYSQAGVIPAGDIYLQATSEMRTRSSFSLHDNNGTTAIAPIYINKVEGQSAWYTLDGRQLPTAPSQKGIYINNGKKVVIK